MDLIHTLYTHYSKYGRIIMVLSVSGYRLLECRCCVRRVISEAFKKPGVGAEYYKRKLIK